jgi:hypothetical protein
MTDLETAARRAIATLRMRYRVTEIPQADDEAVRSIMAAAEGYGVRQSDPAAAHQASEALVRVGGSLLPAITTAVVSSDAALTSLQDRVSQLEELTGTILGTFRKSPNGWNARAKLADMDEWRERLGGQE